MELDPSGDQRDVSDATSALVDHLLAVARTRLGMELSWVSSFVDGFQVFDHVGGDLNAIGVRRRDASPLEDSYCARVIDGRIPNLVPDTSHNEQTAGLEVTEVLGLGSYIGVPVHEDGRAVGMLCCVSRGPAHHLQTQDVHTLELIAELIAEILSRESPRLRRDRDVTERVMRTIVQKRMTSVFQPIVAIEDGTVVGVESLTRFSEPPTRPDVWFAEAASVGLGVELEIAAIEQALDELQNVPPSQFMTLNASPATVADPRLYEVLARSQPDRCVVEVTEHAVVEDYASLGGALESLRELGVRIAVDDVGAGFASLAHVLELQPSILKIDRSIVKGIHLDPARQALAQAIMGVARRLDADVVAEGIEVPAELHALAPLGVRYVQGFLLGRPGSPQAPPRIALPAGHTDEPQVVAAEDVEQELAVRRFELAMLHSPVGMALVSIDGSFVHVNPAFATMLGRRERDFDDLNFQSVTYPDDLDVCQRLVQECLDGARDSYRLEKRYQRADGAIIWGDVSVVLVRSSTRQPMYFIAQVQDTTDRHQREHDLAERATTDHLTAIANRSAASERLEHLATSATAFGVLYCDLRNFKAINDTHGHRAGDHVLIAVAQRLKQMTRPDDHVARWGGDEFLIIVPDPTPRSLRRLADRVTSTVAQPVSLHPGVTTATPCITVGTALFDPDSDDSIDAVLHRADTHMYHQRETHGSVGVGSGDPHTLNGGPERSARETTADSTPR